LVARSRQGLFGLGFGRRSEWKCGGVGGVSPWRCGAWRRERTARFPGSVGLYGRSRCGGLDTGVTQVVGTCAGRGRTRHGHGHGHGHFTASPSTRLNSPCVDLPCLASPYSWPCPCFRFRFRFRFGRSLSVAVPDRRRCSCGTCCAAPCFARCAMYVEVASPVCSARPPYMAWGRHAVGGAPGLSASPTCCFLCLVQDTCNPAEGIPPGRLPHPQARLLRRDPVWNPIARRADTARERATVST
jgi:hypothetical protein